MRIAYVSADRGIPLFGAKGASIHIREMVGALAGLGHEVTVFSPGAGEDAGALDARRVPVDVPELREPASAGDVEARTRAKERRSMAIAERALELLVNAHRERPFDLVYERYSLFSAAGVRAARRLGVPCLLEMNAPLVSEQREFRRLWHEREAKAIEREVLHGAHGVLAVSEEVAAYARSRGAAPARVHVVRNAVDTARFDPRVRPVDLPAPDDRFVVGFAGSLKPWHGIEPLLDAFRDLAAAHPAYHLLIVGDGPMREWIAGYTRGARLEDRVTVTGWTPYEQLPGMLAAMDVAVAPYPALPGFYFSPLKLFEYMAMRRCIVASRIGQVAEVIEDGRTGLLCEPGDAAALASCIEGLRRDPVQRARLSRALAEDGRVPSWRDNAARALDVARECPRTLQAAV